MTWLEAVPAALMTFAVFFVPGTVILLAGRLPWLPALCAAPAVSVGVAVIGAVVSQWIGVPWGLLPFAAFAAVFVVIGAGLGWALRERAHGFPTGTTPLFALAGVLAAAPLAIIPFAIGMGAPDNPPQTWDAVFHLNALRSIVDTGDASTLTLGTLSAPDRAAGFYPAGWHDIISAAIGTATIPTYANMGSLVILGFVWPAGLALLAAVVFPKAPVAALIAPVLGSCFAAFPARVLTFGTLWPTALATALLPALIALTVLALARGITVRSRIRIILAALFTLGGSALAQPSGLFAFIALAAPYVLWRAGTVVLRWWREGRHRLAVIAPAVAVFSFAAVATFVVQSGALNSVANFRRGAQATYAQAIGEALFDSSLGNQPYGTSDAFWLLGLAVIVGFVLLASQPARRWLCVTFAVAVVLYAIAMGPDGYLRLLTAPWYSDPVRLAGLVPIAGTLLATTTFLWLSSRIESRILTRYRTTRRGRAGRQVAATVALLLLFLALTAGGGAERRYEQAARDYSAVDGDGGFLVTPSEQDLLERLGEEIPDGEVMIGNPFNGSALAYVLGGQEVLFPHMSGAWGDDRRYLGQNFDQRNEDPRVCELLDEFNVTYFYDDGFLYLPQSPWQLRYSGLSTEEGTEGLEAVDTGDRATLYRITACDQ